MKKLFLRKPVWFASLAVLLVLSALAALRAGSTRLGTGDFWGGLLCLDGFEKQSIIIYSVRFPRVLGAILAGAGLSVSGVLLQSVTGNELAAPNIIGVNSGAGVAVIALLWLSPKAAAATPFAAFFGAFLTAVLIMFVASRIENTRSTVILAGIAVTTLLNAGISFISMLDGDVLASYNYFSLGGLSGVTLEKLPIPAVLIFIGLFVAILLSRRIDALCLGDGIAVSLGIRVKLLRVVCLGIASACAAAVVSFAGLLGFVGLVVPHISRRLCGSTMERLLPTSALIGAAIVTLADLLGRVLFAPSEVPVGIIMAFIGAPFFFTLLLGRKKRC